MRKGETEEQVSGVPYEFRLSWDATFGQNTLSPVNCQQMQTKPTKNYIGAKIKIKSPNPFVISHVFLHWDHFNKTCQNCLSGVNESNNLQKYTIKSNTTIAVIQVHIMLNTKMTGVKLL